MRVCNFELAVELSNESDTIDLSIDACSIIYASPVVLEFFTGSASPSSKEQENLNLS